MNVGYWIEQSLLANLDRDTNKQWPTPFLLCHRIFNLHCEADGMHSQWVVLSSINQSGLPDLNHEPLQQAANELPLVRVHRFMWRASVTRIHTGDGASGTRHACTTRLCEQRLHRSRQRQFDSSVDIVQCEQCGESCVFILLLLCPAMPGKLTFLLFISKAADVSLYTPIIWWSVMTQGIWPFDPNVNSPQIMFLHGQTT